MLQLAHFSTETIKQFMYFPLLDTLLHKLLKKSLALINSNKQLRSLNYVSCASLASLLKDSHSKANTASLLPIPPKTLSNQSLRACIRMKQNLYPFN